MDESINTQPTEQVAVEQTSLPSDVAEQRDIESRLNFNLTDDVKEKYVTKDGKLLGKYETLEQLAEAHKFLQDKHAMYVDDTKKQEREVLSGVEQEQQNLKKQQTLMSMLPTFMANNMELTPELEAKAVEVGIDIRDLKLGALELKDKVNHVHQLVGGKENWEATKAYLSDKLSPQDFEKINQDLVSANSDYTVLGMYNAYKASLDGTEVRTRISGDTAVKTSKGYENRLALFKDREYLNTPAGRKDQLAKKRYDEKLALTDLNQLGIKSR
jgi:hypothetical protein